MSQVECVLPASNALYTFDGGDKDEAIWTASSPGKRHLNHWREDGVCPRKRSRRPRRFKKATKSLDWHPAAPYNTNQFLMEEHDDLQESDLDATEEGVTQSDTESERKDNANDDAFFDREFSTTYADVRAERLHDMSKTELITEYLQLEDRVDRLERRLKELGVPAIIDTRPKLFATPRHELETPAHLHLDLEDEDDDDVKSDDSEVADDDGTAEKIRIFENEISNLENQNAFLRQQYQQLHGLYDQQQHLCWCCATASSTSSITSPMMSEGPDSGSSSSSSDSDSSDSESSSSDSESDSAESLSSCSTECSCCSDVQRLVRAKTDQQKITLE